MKKFAVVAASAMLGATLLFGANAGPAFAAAKKVDCDAVMNEVGAGKHAKEVAKDLSISVSSVYRCKRHAKEAAKASTKAMTATNKSAAAASAAAMASPAAKASPAAH